MFGDDDPEDAWDEGDPIEVKLELLERWVPSIRVERLGAHDHKRVVTRILLALAAVHKLSLETADLSILGLLGALRDRLLEMQEEEGA